MHRQALVFFTLLLLSVPVRADSVRADRHLSREEVTRMSAHVLAVRATKVDHAYNSTWCRGADVRYMGVFRVEVLVTRVLKGDPTLKGRRLWLLEHQPAFPCAWIRLDWIFLGSLAPWEVAPKSTFLTYIFDDAIAPGADGQTYVDIVGLDTMAQLQPVLTVLADKSLGPLAQPSKPPSFAPEPVRPRPTLAPELPEAPTFAPVPSVETAEPSRSGNEPTDPHSGCSCAAVLAKNVGSLTAWLGMLCGAVLLTRRRATWPSRQRGRAHSAE